MVNCLSDTSLDVKCAGLSGLGRIASFGNWKALAALLLFLDKHGDSFEGSHDAASSIRIIGIKGNRRLLASLCAKLGKHGFTRRCVVSTIKFLKPRLWTRSKKHVSKRS